MRGQNYADNIAKRLDAERDRAARLDSRASSVVATATTVVSLLVAVVAVFQNHHLGLPTTTRTAGGLAIVAIATSAVLGVLSTVLRKYKVPDEATLKSSLSDHWSDSDNAALLACAWMDLDTLLSLRSVNNKRTWWLDRALWAQFTGVALLGVSAVWEIAHL